MADPRAQEKETRRPFEEGPHPRADQEPLKIDLDALPRDAEFLVQLVRDLVHAFKDQVGQIERLRKRIEDLVRAKFGPKSERMAPGQLLLFEELIREALGSEEEPPATDQGSNPEEGAAEDEGQPGANQKSKRPPKKGHGRNPIPEDLRREREEILVPEDLRSCQLCGGALAHIGDDTSEYLDYIPGSIVVMQKVREKLACLPCQANVVVAPLPLRPIEKSVAGPGLLAYVLTSKYADHLPLNRLEGILSRCGVSISRKTMCDWIEKCADLLAPIVIHMASELRLSHHVNLDETSIPVRDPQLDCCRKARLWVFLADEKIRHALFVYTPTKEGCTPKDFLGEFFRGYVQADASNGFDLLFKNPAIIEVGCWSHARRKFFEAQTSDAIRAKIAMAFIGLLFDVERAAKDMDPEARLAMRQEKSRPILIQFKEWMDKTSPCVLPEGPIGKAIQYVRNQWVALNRFLEDGRLGLENNIAERHLRRVAVGRNNWVFAGSDEGGRRAAVIYSLVASCQRVGIDPFAYLRDVLTRLPTHRQAEIGRLTPAAWKAARDADAVARLEALDPASAVS